MLGKKMSMPIGIAPTGFTRMMQTEGEYAGACAAYDAGIPFTLSTMGTRSIEDVAKAAPNGRNWCWCTLIDIWGPGVKWNSTDFK